MICASLFPKGQISRISYPAEVQAKSHQAAATAVARAGAGAGHQVRDHVGDLHLIRPGLSAYGVLRLSRSNNLPLTKYQMRCLSYLERTS